MSSIAAAWYPWATNTSWAAASNCLRRAERGNRVGRAVRGPLAVTIDTSVIRALPCSFSQAGWFGERVRPANWADVATYRCCSHTVASAGVTEERTVEESGQPGGAVPGQNGNAAGPRRDRTRLNGNSWGSDPWSHAGEALEPAADPVVPTWRQPSEFAANLAWAPSPSRYSDLLTPPPARNAYYDGNGYDGNGYNAAGHDAAGHNAPEHEGNGYHPAGSDTGPNPVVRPPASAPPYPYEGDLEDAARLAERDRPLIPGERPVPPPERDERVQRSEPPRHAAPTGGLPTLDPPRRRETLASPPP